MKSIRGAIQKSLRILNSTTRSTLESHDEYVIWRHQQVGRPNPRAQNLMSEDPTGLYWDTQDLVIPVKREGPDDMGRHVFYCRVEPVYGDLFITTVGGGQTHAEVLNAPRGAVYKVVDFDARRDPTGRIISTKVFCEPDRSGQWNEAGQ